MKIKQFRYNSDNLAYVVHHRSAAVVVDGGAVSAICDYVAGRKLVVEALLHTHAHGDHTQGAAALAEVTGARQVDHRRFQDGETMDLAGAPIRVLRTPGHTEDSVCFATPVGLITGDTLFSGTVGNCFSGDLPAFYGSLRRLMAFPPETRIHGGHDYVRESMAFARRLEPENLRIDAYLAARDPYRVVTTLADERAVNPYLRFNEPAIVAWLRHRGAAVDTDYERWHGLMTLT